jgi:hypothetical protein
MRFKKQPTRHGWVGRLRIACNRGGITPLYGTPSGHGAIVLGVSSAAQTLIATAISRSLGTSSNMRGRAKSRGGLAHEGDGEAGAVVTPSPTPCGAGT